VIDRIKSTTQVEKSHGDQVTLVNCADDVVDEQYSSFSWETPRR